jgi:tRNA dimethylallyltransferase
LSGTRAKAILIAGPTAAGKSRLAMGIAALRNGVVINADSMQVYAELRVLTARPSSADEAAVPHRLYGHVPAAERYSAGRWLADATSAIGEARVAGRLPVVVGGTGLYFKALTEGLAAVPAIPPAVHARISEEADGVDTPVLHARLAALDAEDAAAIRRGDRARILRALEVFTVTGKSLAAWRRGTAIGPPVNFAAAERLVLAPDRTDLHQRIRGRAERMVYGDGPAEAEALARLGLDPDLPAMKAIGVRQLIDHAAGKLSLDETVAAIATETRRYAKRQMTWFRNQMADWPTVADAGALDVAGGRA